MKSLTRISLLFIVALYINPIILLPQSDSPLRGLKEVSVLIEDVGQTTRDWGISEEWIKNMVELRLQRESLLISDKPLLPYLYININARPPIFSIHISLNERVTVDRDPTISCFADLWHKGVLGKYNSPASVNAAIEKIVDYFLNEYYKANPKRSNID